MSELKLYNNLLDYNAYIFLKVKEAIVCHLIQTVEKQKRKLEADDFDDNYLSW